MAEWIEACVDCGREVSILQGNEKVLYKRDMTQGEIGLRKSCTAAERAVYRHISCESMPCHFSGRVGHQSVYPPCSSRRTQ